MAENRYRKIEVRMWGDEKFRTLSPLPPSGQGLWLFLLTGPHTGPIPGLFRVGRAALAEELGWPQEAFDKAFDEVFRLGMVKADWKARVVWIPNAIKCNPPQSPNVVRSWAGELHLVPECDLKAEAHRTIESMIYGLGDGFQTAFAKAMHKPSVKPLPNQEQEQEQEQERKPSAATASVADDESELMTSAQLPPEIIGPGKALLIPDTSETPDIVPTECAKVVLEEIRFLIIPKNIQAVAAAIEDEAKTMGVMSAYEFVLECTRDAMLEECEINADFFIDRKYRPERRNSNQRQMSTQVRPNGNTQRNIIPAARVSAADTDRSSPTDAQLEQLYKLYPRKCKKLDAKKAIRKAVGVVMAGDSDHPAMPLEDALNYIAQRITLYARCVQECDPQFIPYPASWFNAGSFWDDERDWRRKQNRASDSNGATKLPPGYVSASEQRRQERNVQVRGAR